MAEENKKFNLTLTPKQKKYAVIGVLIAGMVLIMKCTSDPNSFGSSKKPIENVLTDRSPKELGMESLIAQIKIANDKLTSQAAENKRLKKDFDKLKSDLTVTQNMKRETAQLNQSIADLQRQLRDQQEQTNNEITKLTNENQRLNKLVNSAPAITAAKKEAEEKRKTNDETPRSNARGEITNAGTYTPRPNQRQNTRPFLERSVNTVDPNALYAEKYVSQNKTDTLELDNDGNAVAELPNKINVIGEDDSEREAKARLASFDAKPEVYLPTGTFVKGTLLSGLYAPTGVNARKDPFPVVMRVQDDAILPNLKKADVRECFLTLSGYGDMSSERALLRGDTLSCVANDNSIIETKFPSYAVGEDGKAGISGRLITRNGKALRNAMLAGFASGMSDSFQTERVQKLDISGSSSNTYTQAFSGETLNNGLFNGASEALDKLADYYMSMAEQTFPVIEVDAGREVTVTLTQGTTLSVVKESPEKQMEALKEQPAHKNKGTVDYTTPTEMENPSGLAAQHPELIQ